MSGKRIRGTIIHHCRDPFGEITVADDGNARSLYFGRILQSSIRLGQPDILIEDYNRAMMNALIFRDDLHDILLIGLGGCSLVHFLLRAFPGASVDVVEIRKKVIDLAYDFFSLPRGNSNLKIFHAGGEDFVRQAGEDRRYDLIIIDAFDEAGPATVLLEEDFLSACRRRMQETGICVLNLWSRPRDNFSDHYAAVRRAFEGNALKLLPSEAFWNALVFGFAGKEPMADFSACRDKAKRLKQKYGLDFPRYLKQLYWQNWENRQ